MVNISANAAAAHRIELVPNCSLTPQGARLFVGSLAFVTFGVAGFFAFQGLWPVLPPLEAPDLDAVATALGRCDRLRRLGSPR